MSKRELFELWLARKSDIARKVESEGANVRSLGDYYVHSVLADRIEGFHPELIRRNEHGKPVLHDLPYSFNLSHDGEHYALLLCRSECCGVDVQSIRDAGTYDDAFRSVMTDREYELIGLKGGAGDYYQLWSVKEAYIKAAGSSIWLGRDYDFGTEPGGYSDKWFYACRMWLYSTEIYPRCYLSMALPEKPEKIDFRNF